MSPKEIQRVCQSFIIKHGKLQFECMKILFKSEGKTYLGEYPKRLSPDRHNEIDTEGITNVVLIPPESYCPPVPEECTISPEPLTQDYYMKRIDLMQYGGGLDLARLVLREMKACEALRLRPHPNVAAYHGCQIQDNGVTGLCFLRYPETLMKKMNPKHLNKQNFLSEPIEERKAAASRYLPGITEGLHHIHSLGLAHNDINPSNIMIDSQDRPVIIDFDSCLPFGENMDQVKRTPGWYNEEVTVSVAKNDLDALTEIANWLTSVSVKELSFR